MSDFTPNLQLAYIASGHAQKHITVNENSRALDAMVHLSLRSISRTLPPTLPTEGHRYWVPAGAGGDWTNQTGKIAAWQDGGWIFYEVAAGARAFIGDEGVLAIQGEDGRWLPLAKVLPSGAATLNVLLEETIELTGEQTLSNIVIAAGSMVLAVTATTVTGISGTASYSVGDETDGQLFAANVSTAAGSTHIGVIAPRAYPTSQRLRISANNGTFEQGSVHLVLHALSFELPQL